MTQGTIATNTAELLVPTLQALADEDLLVVATGAGVDTETLPGNVRAATFIPFNELMPHIDVMVTNGGYGGVTIALSNGVPLVCAGTTEDKPEVGNRVAYAGVGINLKTSAPTSAQVRSAVLELLGARRTVSEPGGCRRLTQNTTARPRRHRSWRDWSRRANRSCATSKIRGPAWVRWSHGGLGRD